MFLTSNEVVDIGLVRRRLEDAVVLGLDEGLPVCQFDRLST
jgi:hypothetical protein